MASPDLNEQRMQRYWSRIQRALQVLQKAQRYDLAHDDTGVIMEPCTCGDLILIDDVVKAMQILQEGQQ